MRALVGLSLLVACVTARGEQTLCAAAETVVFSCHVGKKIVSLCRPSEMAWSPGSVWALSPA